VIPLISTAGVARAARGPGSLVAILVYAAGAFGLAAAASGALTWKRRRGGLPRRQAIVAGALAYLLVLAGCLAMIVIVGLLFPVFARRSS
jgi:ABC-type nitrate/sulfonate/bicarbonate transport system substrate-binding protein